MPPLKSDIPPAAQPKFGDHFDAWNSSSAGHQCAENRMGGSTGWRQSRTMKLSNQFKSGGTGGKRISDQVGAGSEHWDENLKALIPKDVRDRARNSIGDMLQGKGTTLLFSFGQVLILITSDHKRRKADGQANEGGWNKAGAATKCQEGYI